MKYFLAIALVLFAFSLSFAQGEQAPILEKPIKYNDWTLKSIRDGNEINLRKIAQSNKLTIVVYFAPWCGNWKQDAPMLERLYEKYHLRGLEIVAVGEYDPQASMKASLDSYKISFPAVYESENRTEKQKTLHYGYRTSTGDTRNWGSPWYIFLEPGQLEKAGDLLIKKTHIINGQMIEAEGDKFIRDKLGVPAADGKTASAKTDKIEVCDTEKKPAELKKP